MTPMPSPAPARFGLRPLLDSLEALGPRPALVWYGEVGRVELSGHVLANWVIKAVGHLEAEIALEQGDSVLLDLPPHWKRLVLALASWGLGAEVTVPAAGEQEDEQQGGRAEARQAPRVVATDRPDSPASAQADEVLALSALSLSLRFEGDLPPLVHDWAQEVRAHSDVLSVPLGEWSGPAPAGPGTTGPDEQPSPRLLVPDDGLAAPSRTLSALLAGRGIVGPAHAMDERQIAQEDARPE
jgi:uncharacterized protein (TIGR03089 family)